jgi:hypothetical protein
LRSAVQGESGFAAAAEAAGRQSHVGDCCLLNGFHPMIERGRTMQQALGLLPVRERALAAGWTPDELLLFDIFRPNGRQTLRPERRRSARYGAAPDGGASRMSYILTGVDSMTMLAFQRKLRGKL